MSTNVITRCIIKYEYFKIGVIEVVSIIPKTVFIMGAAVLNGFGGYGILIFGVGQMLYSGCLMCIFYMFSSNKSIFLQTLKVDGKLVYFDPKSKAALK